MERTVDEGDPSVPELEEVTSGQLAAAGVVDRNRAQLAVLAATVEEHHKRAAVTQGLEVPDAAGSRSDDDALDTLLLEEAEVACLSLRRAVTRADEKRA